MSTCQPFCEQFQCSYPAARRPWLPPIFPLLLLGVGLAMAQPCLANPFTFDATGSMSAGRSNHTATLLQNGKVLVVGGFNGGTLASAGVELYDPARGTWMPTGSLHEGRGTHTATLLPDGRVLVTGGIIAPGNPLGSAELYDPNTGTWTATGSMTIPRADPTATLLPSGMVIVVGGTNGDGYSLPGFETAELYDPSKGTWVRTGSMHRQRFRHTATLLSNGKVLVVGGRNSEPAYLDDAELYDPSTEKWTFTNGSMSRERYGHTATLLPNGKVLVAGGSNTGFLESAELYDPSSGMWAFTNNNLGTARTNHMASLLPNGKVLVSGGEDESGSLASAELYDPSSATWAPTGSLTIARSKHSSTLLPDGKVLVAGGSNPSLLVSCELFDASNGAWFATASTVVAHAAHTATILPNGQVLVAGGTTGSTTLGTTELYDVPTAKWVTTASLNALRKFHTATLLPNGKVLVAGGAGNNALASAELYDRADATWTNTGSLNTSRYDHTATLLPNGKVLVAGGVRSAGIPPTTTYVAATELYDPASGTWAVTGSLATARHNHTATLLPNGKVLVSGGANANNNYLATCELYDPATGAWSATGSMANPRELHTATLLPRAQVLVAGGTNDSTAQGIVLNSVEIYNPATGLWVTVPSLSTGREGHSATLMPDGRVLIYGGLGDGNSYLATAELYDPAINKWTATGSGAARVRHTATLLPNGRVLAVGGFFGSNTATTNASLYDAGFGFVRPDWQPQISSAFSTTSGNALRLFVNGSRFQGLFEASGGGTNNSATNYPVVQLRSIDNSQVAFFPVDPATGWSDSIFASTSVSSFPFGPAFATVFANGIPSDSRFLVVDPTATPSPTPGTLRNISTRVRVLGGDNVLIAGMIATGNVAKKVIIRAIGPTLADLGVPDALTDPTLELFRGDTSLASNDDWRNSSQQAEIQNSGVAPGNDAEAAIIATLTPGQSYTAVVRGKNDGTGVGLVEVYDIAPAANSKLANISTRGFVGVDDNVMIAGLIVGPADGSGAKVLVRALGPTLADVGVPGALTNPTLKLVDSNGTAIRSNDDWRTSQETAISAAGLAPSHDEEAALIETIPPGQYTAVVRGVGQTTGAGLVELYNIQ